MVYLHNLGVASAFRLIMDGKLAARIVLLAASCEWRRSLLLCLSVKPAVCCPSSPNESPTIYSEFCLFSFSVETVFGLNLCFVFVLVSLRITVPNALGKTYVFNVQPGKIGALP